MSRSGWCQQPCVGIRKEAAPVLKSKCRAQVPRQERTGNGSLEWWQPSAFTKVWNKEGIICQHTQKSNKSICFTTEYKFWILIIICHVFPPREADRTSLSLLWMPACVPHKGMTTPSGNVLNNCVNQLPLKLIWSQEAFYFFLPAPTAGLLSVSEMEFWNKPQWAGASSKCLEKHHRPGTPRPQLAQGADLRQSLPGKPSSPTQITHWSRQLDRNFHKSRVQPRVPAAFLFLEYVFNINTKIYFLCTV